MSCLTYTMGLMLKITFLELVSHFYLLIFKTVLIKVQVVMSDSVLHIATVMPRFKCAAGSFWTSHHVIEARLLYSSIHCCSFHFLETTSMAFEMLDMHGFSKSAVLAMSWEMFCQKASLINYHLRWKYLLTDYVNLAQIFCKLYRWSCRIVSCSKFIHNRISDHLFKI